MQWHTRTTSSQTPVIPQITGGQNHVCNESMSVGQSAKNTLSTDLFSFAQPTETCREIYYGFGGIGIS